MSVKKQSLYLTTLSRSNTALIKCHALVACVNPSISWIDATAPADMSKKKVCVVGAGMSGLAAARELRREGLAVTVMEQRGDVGGQWHYDPRTDGDDPLGATAPVKVHSSMYASVRLISPRECMGFSDFQFVPRPGRDARRFPGHREVYCYLKDFCAAFGLADVVWLNTRVVRVAMAAVTRK